jgi:hypothetical protein
LANHQETFRPACDRGNRTRKGIQKDDVTIRVAKQVMPRNLLRAGEHIVDPNAAIFTMEYVRHVMDSEFRGNFASPRNIPKKDHPTIPMEQRPAAQRVSLSRQIAALKRLGGGKNSKHLSST